VAANTGLTNLGVSSIAVAPSSPSTLYVGTDGDGVFKSTNGGGIWVAVNTDLSEGFVDSIAVAPSSPSTLYAGTSGGGVFKSTDGGAGWTAMNRGLTNTVVYPVVVNPSRPWILYAGTWGGGVFDLETCGNGILDPGEQCDDGNLVDGDGCSATCQSELIPGGLRKADCVHEWMTAPVAPRDRKGVPLNRLQCADDDPSCDFGASPGICTFRVKLCFNVLDVRLPKCTPTGVVQVDLLNPWQAMPRDDTDRANRDQLEAALTGLGGAVRGKCVNWGPRLGQLCAASSDCDSAIGSGDGVCQGRFVAFDPPDSNPGRCTAFVNIQVPRGKAKRLSLRATPSNDPVTGRKRLSNTDGLTLTCKPPP
jgi:cysteine-rich repeat protein